MLMFVLCMLVRAICHRLYIAHIQLPICHYLLRIRYVVAVSVRVGFLGGHFSLFGLSPTST